MDKPNSLYLTPRKGPAKQQGNWQDQAADHARIEREMDKNGVPRTLQSQIAPERVEQMHDASIKLPPYSVPRVDLPNSGGAAYSPRPATGGAAATATGQPMMRPGEADKAMQITPPKSRLENPLKYKGIEAVPSLNREGGELEFRVPWEKIFRSK